MKEKKNFPCLITVGICKVSAEEKESEPSSQARKGNLLKGKQVTCP